LPGISFPERKAINPLPDKFGREKEAMKPGQHSHNFVNEYQGLVGFGLDRETDEKSLKVYLQKFSDDTFLKILLPRLTEGEIEEILVLISRLLKTHLKEEEYHQLFLKENGTTEDVKCPQC
jgi:hypothetical protein